MLSLMIRELLCQMMESRPVRRTRRTQKTIQSLEVRTLLAGGLDQGTSAIPVIIHTRSDAANAPVLPTTTQARQSLNGGGLQFNFVASDAVPQQVKDGFAAAGQLWSNLFTDDIMVNILIDFEPLGPGILGSALSYSESVEYSTYRTSLIADAKSTSDTTATANLSTAQTLSLNTSSYTSGIPGTPMIDNNNTNNNRYLDLNTANSKAIGFRTPGNTAVDAEISFSSNFSWDFDRSNGISSNAYDFVGVAAHEIGHALGFVSGADVVDATTGAVSSIYKQSLDQYRVVTGLDLFRVSTASIANGTDLDIRADTTTKYFSIDGGTTLLTTFSTGVTNGDGRQASHWKDSLGIGIMDPTLGTGEIPTITQLDILSFDVIGWDVRSTSGTNNAPVLNDQTLPSLNENVANGTIVGTVVATDVDANQTLTYSIIDGNTSNAFSINSSTGQITVNNRVAVDYETNPVFQLTVQVRDNGSPAKLDTGFVTININNLNDLDFGDLPDTFGTNLGSNGARHQTVTGLFLGSGVTNELNGQPGTTATLDSDDGVTAPSSMTPGSNAQFTVTASQAGRLDVFIDFNGNGVFDSSERTTPVGGLVVNAGTNVVTVSVPSNASVGQRGARFRLSSIGGLNATGLASDGEVEDYFVSVAGSSVFYDFGDLPDTFGTLLVSNGARHATTLAVPMKPLLGRAVDSEYDGQPSPLADADGSPTWGDENGVTLPATLTPGTTAQFSAEAYHGGKLDAFIDFNGNGVFDANERVTPAGGVEMTNYGVNNFSVNVPANAVGGQRGVRFRISTDGGLGPIGPAADGEVEDYFVTVVSTSTTYDFGDLPDTFGTLLASNGARHQTGGGLFLGNSVSSEPDGQPDPSAFLDRDEGVTPEILGQGVLAYLTVRASQAGKLDAFIDFNGNGRFDTDERVTPAGGMDLTAGSNVLRVLVPTNAVPGDRGARFRISSAGGLSALGPAVDGEVEDYFFYVAPTTYDLGDLPDTFGTLLSSNGPRHFMPTRVFLGGSAESDLDAQPSPLADTDTGDDGVILPTSFTAGSTATISVTTTVGGKLDAFIDFNGNGVFDTNERVTPVGGLVTNAGVNNVVVNVPGNAVSGQRGARFRLSTAGGLAATGPAVDGEVEDYFVTVISSAQSLDFGDLPDTYGTMLATNGARHQTGSGLFLGTGVTSEADGQPNITASLDSDDGVTLPASLIAGTSAQFTVRASRAGKLDAFIDFNENNQFEPNERVTPVGGLAVTAGPNTVTVNVPSDASPVRVGARFRISTTGGLAATGLAADGEVEDYYLPLFRAPFTYDFGDLPDSFGTLLSSDGARHQTADWLGLGPVSTESDGKPSPDASADSNDNGVVIPASLTPGTTAQFLVTVFSVLPPDNSGKLDAFIDFNGNGVFDTNERVTPIGGLAISVPSNTLSQVAVLVNVPSDAVPGQRGARFRLSRVGGLGPKGPTEDGEVEDYFVTVGTPTPKFDFGDLPNTFGTTLASDGARHQTGGGLFLGTGVTSEADGQPSTTANLDTDDGVTIPASLTAGSNVQFTVKASQAGKLDAFIDFNGNGVFDTNERVTPAGGLAVVAGNNNVTVSVPRTAVVGQRGARFRLSAVGGLAATGLAANGEVEDYFVSVVGPPTYDFGDLPNTFGTLLANNGARHQTGGGLYLGSGVTNETNGKPSATANLDVDDGVTAPATLAPRVTAQFTVTASKAGKLDAFIDFNGNGVFDTDERVTPAGGQALVAGQNTISVTVPDTAVAGQLGARFRISTVGGLAATGLAADGEVEDYFVNVVRYDFGDLPNTFGTTLASNGARHEVGGGLYLGATVTSEADGQPGTTASLDNDDGVTVPDKLVPKVNAQFKVNASTAGKLDAFIDFNGNGRFDTNERITPVGGLSLVAGLNTVNVTVPDTAVNGQRGARFRISTTGGLAATGLAADGEVEDYFVNVVHYDFGDLPNTFGTTLASNGARHQVGSGLFLGTAVTSDADGQPSDTASLDSDDGVTIPTALLPQSTAQFTVRASKAGKLDAFIDFNGNGIFDSNERVTPAGGLVLTAGLNTVNVTVPSNAVVGQRAARFRLSTAGGLTAKGEALDGEVEDYFVRVAQNDFGDLPDTFGTTLAQDGARHLTGTGLYLGAGVTSELNGLPSALANRDRDDGVTFSSTLIAGLGARIEVVASQAGKLDAFIDFNGNGVFDLDERVTPVGGLALTAGTSSVYFEVPETAVAGARAARFRLSSAGGLSAKGAAADGEVEDYLLNVVSPEQDTIQLLPDPENPGQRLIYINGTSGNDTISVAKTNLGFTVRMNNKVSPDLDATSRILVYGGDGHDKIALPTSIPLSAIVDGGMGNDSLWGGNGSDVLRGGDGNDVIYARGGSDIVYGGNGNDTIIGDAKSHLMFGEDDNDKITGHGVLVGGAGTDTLVATGSRNVLIGGNDADQLTAALGGDLLIGGTTKFDTNSTALQAILAEWSAAIAVNARIAHLTGSLAGGLNGSFFLVSDAVRPGTVHDDLAIDTFTNTFAEDWLFVFPGDRRTRQVGIVNHS